jgi:hypothetical protein
MARGESEPIPPQLFTDISLGDFFATYRGQFRTFLVGETGAESQTTLDRIGNPLAA